MSIDPQALPDVSASAPSNSHFVWPLGRTTTPDEMNTSYGPRIDADRWDFHDGIDLPAAVGTPVYAAAAGTVHRAGPADKTTTGQGFGSTHVLLKVTDPTDGVDDLFLVYLHLDSIAEGVIAGAHVNQGDLIGAVGQEDATYPHLHFEFRKTEPSQQNSRHALRYLPYINGANVTQLRLDRCNFSGPNGQRRAVRFRFDVLDRREGDVQGVDVELRGRNGDGIVTRSVRVDFDDRSTIVSDKGDEHAFNDQGVAVEGYQKSNLKGEGLFDLNYGVIVRDITPEFKFARLRVFDVRDEHPGCVEVGLPELHTGEQPVHSRVEFEDATFPPAGWQQDVRPGNVCRPDPAAALDGEQGLLCQDLHSPHGSLIRAGLGFALPVARLPVRPTSWRLRADLRPAQLQMRTGSAIFPLAFLAGDRVVAAACLREVRNDKLFGGVMIRGADGLVRERIDVTEGEIFRDAAVRWELELLRLGTRQTTVILRLDNNVIARVNGDTTSVEPDTACVGITHEHSDVQAALHFDRLLLTETLR
jgi:Peptidase family M23